MSKRQERNRGQDQLRDQSDETRLADAIAIANIPALLMVLLQLTRDRQWLDHQYRTKRAHGMNDNDSGGHSEEVQGRIRAAAFEAILAWRGGRPIALPDLSRELRLKMLRMAMGEPIPDEYDSIIGAELAALRNDAVEKPPVPKGFRAIIIGAGVSGLCAAANLQQAGIPFTILEKNNQLRGIWRDNRYPGAGVDTPNHLYSFTNASSDMSMYYVLRDELHAYLEHVADKFSLRKNIRFGTAAKSAVYGPAAQQWRVEVAASDGSAETLEANVVISAVGIFNPIKLPNIKGLDRLRDRLSTPLNGPPISISRASAWL